VKTISLKKVSAVAVASLGFGLLSVVPANAVISTTTTELVGTVTGATETTTTGTYTVAASTLVTVPIKVTLAAAVGVTAVVITPTLTTPTGGSAPTLTTSLTGNAASAVTGAAVTTANSATKLSLAAPSGTAAAITATVIGDVSFTPTTPGVYKLVLASDTSGTDNTATIYINVGLDISTAYPRTAVATQGSNITSAWSATANGQATARFTNFAASTVYYVTATNATIGTVTQGDTASNLADTFTNGVNYVEGSKITTGSSTVALDYVDVQILVGASGTASLKVVSYSSSTGLPTTFSNPSVTIGVVPAPSAQYSTLGLNETTGTAITTAASDTTNTVAAKTANSQKFNIMVAIKDQYNVAYNGVVLGASITGPGSLGLDTDQDGSAASTGRSLTATLADNAGQVSVYGDGTAGTSVITITATTTAGVTTVLGSKTVKFAGSPAKATVTQLLNVAKAGTQLGENPSTSATTNTNAGAEASSVAFLAEVMDSNGVDVAAGSTVKMTSSDTSVITVGTCSEYSAYPGNFECSVSGAAAAASGKTATVTFAVYNSTTAAYDITATPITFAIGGAIAKVVVTTDKTSYGAGEAVALVATATDSSGNKAYDGQTPYVTAPTSNKTVGGAFPANTVVINNGKKSTTGTSASLFAPSVSGSFLISGTWNDGVTTTGTAFKLTADVVDGNAALLTQIDALNAKIVALNALIAKIMKKLGVK